MRLFAAWAIAALVAITTAEDADWLANPLRATLLDQLDDPVQYQNKAKDWWEHRVKATAAVSPPRINNATFVFIHIPKASVPTFFLLGKPASCCFLLYSPRRSA